MSGNTTAPLFASHSAVSQYGVPAAVVVRPLASVLPSDGRLAAAAGQARTAARPLPAKTRHRRFLLHLCRTSGYKSTTAAKNCCPSARPAKTSAMAVAGLLGGGGDCRCPPDIHPPSDNMHRPGIVPRMAYSNCIGNMTAVVPCSCVKPEPAEQCECCQR